MKRTKGIINPKLLELRDLVGRISGNKSFTSPNRSKANAYLRFVYMKLSRDYTGASLAEIGEVCGNRDHATVRSGLLKFNEIYATNDFTFYRELYAECKSEIEKGSFFNTISNHTEFVSSSQTEELTTLQERHIAFLSKIIDRLSHRSVFNKIASLREEDLNDFETRAKAFLSMNRIQENNPQLKIYDV